MTEKELIQAVWHIFKKHFNTVDCRLYLFGSRASGTANEHSDFDFIIQSGKGLRQPSLLEFKREIDEISTLYSIDVVDWSQAAPDFQKIAQKNMKEVVNGQI